MRGDRNRFTRPAERAHRFTAPAAGALGLAEEEAAGLGHHWLGTEHLLLGLLREKEGIGGEALRYSGIDLDFARRRTVELVGPVDGSGEHAPGASGEPRPTPRAERLLRRARPEAWHEGAAKAGTAHLLLVLLGDQDGLAYRTVADAGVPPGELEREVRRMVNEGRNDGITAEELREEVERLREAADAMNEAYGRSLWRMMLPGLVVSLTTGASVGAGVYAAIRLARKK